MSTEEEKYCSKGKLENFSFLNYNVCGLTEKLSDHTFVDFVTTHDFITFTETFISDEEFESPVFKDYKCFVAKAIKLSKTGRLSGGVIVLVKKHLSDFISRIKTDHAQTIVVRISKDLFDTDVDVMFISAYVQPYDSVFWKHTNGGYGLEVIEECIVCLHEKCEDFLILLSGDFNARPAKSNYEAINDDFEEGDRNIPSDHHLFERRSDDTERNIFGDQLIELCKISESFILNGAIKWNCDAGYTYVAHNGSSVVDYFVMSCSMCSNFIDIKLNIKEHVYSDHLPVQMILSIQSGSTQRQQSPKLDPSTIEKTSWDKEKEYIYVNKLSDEEGLTLLKEATDQIDEDVNKSLVLFTEFLLRASACMKKVIPLAKSSKRSEWFDVECKQAKKDCRSLLREYRKVKKSERCICPESRHVAQTSNSISHSSCICHEKRLAFIESRKVYRKLLKQKRQQFQRDTAENLAKNINSSSVFWNDLKKLGLKNKSRRHNNIPIQEWFNHFQKLFSVDENFKDNAPDTDINVEEDEDHFLNQVITIQEVEVAIKKIKSGKASGADGILGEMLKAGGRSIIIFLTLLFNKIFDSSIYPSEWSKAIVVPIFKKGNSDDPDNYRGVSLINIICKCFTSIMNKRLYLWLEENKVIAENQAGFRREYSTIDQIYTLYAIVQKSLSYKGRKLYVAFVDFKKAFDSVQHNKLLTVLKEEGVKGKYFCFLKAMYESLVSCVRCNGAYSEYFDCPVGVRQGCGLSPTLFSLFINQLASHVNSTGVHGVQLLPTYIEIFILLFADDVALISTSPGGLQAQLNSLKECCQNLGLFVNMDKTKIMVFRKGGYLGIREKWFFDGKQIEVVNSYCYLGFTFTTMLSWNIGTKHLVTKAKKALYLLCRAFQNCKEMSKDVFFKIFDAKIQSILMYSSEIWGNQRLDQIEKVHLLACKRYLGVPLKTPNKLVYSELGRFPLHINSTVKTLKYWFRLLQMDDNRLSKQAYLMLVSLDEKGKKCWVSGIREVLCKAGFMQVWINQGVDNTKVFLSHFKQRLVDIYLQEWMSSVRGKERYDLYRSVQTDFGDINYFKCVTIYCLRVALTQIRLGVLPIRINTERFSQNPDAKFCLFCKNVDENEHHFIFVCPLYADLRRKFLGSLVNVHINILLSGVYNNMTRSVAKYIFHSVRLRQKIEREK